MLQQNSNVSNVMANFLSTLARKIENAEREKDRMYCARASATLNLNRRNSWPAIFPGRWSDLAKVYLSRPSHILPMLKVGERDRKEG